MSRRSLKVRIAKIIQKFPFHFLHPIERFLVHNKNAKLDNSNLVFLLALPRSGSTLTYQILCHSLRFNYLSNIWLLLFQLPWLGGKVSAYLTKNYFSDFKSQHGLTEGIIGPAEGLDFWRYWAGFDLCEQSKERDLNYDISIRRDYLSSVLESVSDSQRPFLTAYLGHTLDPVRLMRMFPNAKYIRLRREPVSNALSLLNSMRKSKSSWLSIVPGESSSSINLTEHEKVASQVYWLNRRLDKITTNKCLLDLSYENLCSNPKQEIERVILWLKSNNINPLKSNALPESFVYKRVNYENADAILIKKEIDLLELKYGKLVCGESDE